jgi:hypothetical protein
MRAQFSDGLAVRVVAAKTSAVSKTCKQCHQIAAEFVKRSPDTYRAKRGLLCLQSIVAEATERLGGLVFSQHIFFHGLHSRFSSLSAYTRTQFAGLFFGSFRGLLGLLTRHVYEFLRTLLK